MAVEQIIESVSISTADFTELADNILSSMVTQAGGVFEQVMDKFETYIDSTEVDDIQKQAAYAQFLKDVYSDINKQALSSALDLLKSNAQLSFERYKVEADYNAALKSIEKTNEDIILLGKTATKMDRENEILLVTKATADSQLVEQRAKLKKQYGVQETTTIVLGDGTSNYMQHTDGVWYKVNSSSQFVTTSGTVTTTPATNGVKAVVNSLGMTTTLANTTAPGAIDKQIAGYDFVNYKDVLKTMDERAALMQNAKVPETANEKAARLSLIKALATDIPAIANLTTLA